MSVMSAWHASALLRNSQARADGVLALAQELLRTPSTSGKEQALGNLLLERMRAAGFVDVACDELGNCYGRIRGQGHGPSTLYLCPLDSPEIPGEFNPDFHPYGGVFDGCHLHGWGASDAKGALAAMVQAGELLAQSGLPLPGDFILAGVCHNALRAGIGVRHLVEHTLLRQGWHYDLVVLGHPTNLHLSLGQRGRLALDVTLTSHAIPADFGHLAPGVSVWLSEILGAITSLAGQMPGHRVLDPASLLVTGVRTRSPGVALLPDQCVIRLERRWLPFEDIDAIIWHIQEGLTPSKTGLRDCYAAVTVSPCIGPWENEGISVPAVQHPFLTDSRHGVVTSIRKSLDMVEQVPETGKWVASYDGGYPAMVKKILTVGYAPGDPNLAHTASDRVALEDLVKAMAGYAAIAVGLAGVLNR